ncbi:MAG: PAS domain S-box protein [Lentisphaerae bacterium]|nr:PAS domain S-box protein [Lentisphaerota bacterium]
MESEDIQRTTPAHEGDSGSHAPIDQLQEAEARYRAVFEGAPLGILIADSETRRFRYANPAICALLGYAPQELTTMTVADIHPPEQLEHIVAEFEAQARGDKMLAPDIPCRRKDGDTVYADITVSIVEISGRPHNVGFFTDITERKLTEETLQHYERIVAGASDMMALIDAGFVYLAANDAYLGGCGKPREDVIGHTVSEVLGERVFTDVVKPNAERCLRGETVRHHTWLTPPDRGRRLMDVVYSPHVDRDGNIAAFSVCSRDVTQRRLAEEEAERLAKFPSQNPNPVLRVAPDGTILYANRGSTPLLEEWETAEGDCLPQGYVECVTAAIESGMTSDTDVDCGDRVFNVVFCPLGDRRQINLYGLDITARKRAEEEAGRLAKFPSEDPNPVLRIDADGTIVYANAGSAPLLAEWGCTAGSRLPDAQADLAARCLEDEIVVSTDVPCGERTFSLTFCPVPGLRQVNLYGMDITARTLREQEVRELNETLGAAQKMAKVGYWRYDIASQMPTWSDQMFEVCGYRKQDGVPSYDKHKLTWHPDDWEEFDQAVQGCERGKPYDIVIRIRFPDSSYHYVHTQGFPVYGKNGEIRELFGTSQDITELKRVEESLRQQGELLNSVERIAEIGGWEMDLITRKATWTQGTYDIVEIEPGQPIPGPDEHMDYYLPEYRDMVSEAMRTLIVDNKPLDFEAKCCTARGNTKWVRAIGRADWEGETCTRVYGTLQDVTKRKQAEAELAGRRNELEALCRISETALSNSPMGTLLDGFVQEISRATSFPIAAIEFYHAAEERMEFAASVGIPLPDGKATFSVPVDSTLSGTVARTGTSLVETHAGTRPEYSFRRLRELSVETFVCVPLSLAGETVGALSLAHPESTPIPPAFVRFVSGLGNIVTTVISNKRAEEALRNSEARFREMFENHNAIMLLIEPDSGRIVDANRAASRFYGYPHDQLCSMSIDQINCLSPEEIKAERERASRLKQNFFIFSHRCASGTVRTVDVHATPIEFHGKQLLFSIIHDTTARENARHRLQQSEARFRNLFENSPYGILVCELIRDDTGTPTDFVHLQANEAVATHTGMSTDGVVGRRASEMVDGDTLAPILETYGGVVETGAPARYSQYFELYDRTLDVTAFSLNGDLFIINFFDVSERVRAQTELREHRDHLEQLVEERTEALAKLSEEQRTILDSVRATIWYKDTENRILRVNRAAADALGLSIEAIEGKLTQDLFPEDADGYYRDDLEVIHSGKPKLGIAEEFRAAGGDVRWVLTDKIPYRDEAGKVAGVIAFALDITEQKQAEEAARERAEELRTMVRAMAGREVRMAEMKEEIRELHARLPDAGVMPGGNG